MTNLQCKRIESMMLHGFSNRGIAEALSIPGSTLRTYISKHPELSEKITCKCCGNPITQDPGKRLKGFCSPRCRTQWWNGLRNGSRGPVKKCEYCGKDFRSYGNKHYCSRKCYLDSVSQN